MADVQPLRALHYDLGGHRRAAARWSARPTTSSTPRSAPSWPRARRTTSSTSTSPSPTRSGTRPPRPLRPRRRGAARLARRGRRRPGRRAGRLGARAGLHRARRAAPEPPRVLRRRARRGLRPRPDPPARAHAPRPQGGPAAPDARDGGEPLADLLALRRPRAARPGARSSRPPAAAPWGEATDEDGTTHRLWRVADPGAIAAVQAALADAELLIADGHHRYETARVYAEEIGGEGAAPLRAHVPRRARGPGPDDLPHPPPRATAWPTTRPGSSGSPRPCARLRHRRGPARRAAPARRPGASGPLTMGYLDAHFERAFRLTLKDQAIADRALAGHARALPARSTPPCSRRSCSKGPLGLTEDDISHLRGLGYSRTDEEARRPRARRRLRRRLLPAREPR